MWNSFCVAYTKYTPRNVMIQDVCSSWICHGEQSACHVVYYRRGYIPVCARLTYVSFKASESGHFIFMGVTRCRRSFFYLVIRSSLLLLFHTPAFLQSAFLLRADYSEELCSHRPTFHGRQHFTVWTFGAGCASSKLRGHYWLSQANIQRLESAQQTCLRISENIWMCLKVFESLWNYLKAKEILLQCLCFPCCCCCWIELDELSLLTQDFVRRKWYGNLCWTIPIKKSALVRISVKEKMPCRVLFLERNANDVLHERLLITNIETSCWTVQNVERSSALVCLIWNCALSLTWKPWY